MLALVIVAGALLVIGRELANLMDEGLSKQDPELLNRSVIAHRLATVVRADWILLVDNGRIVATGKHE